MTLIEERFYGFEDTKELSAANEITEEQFIGLLRSRYSCLYRLEIARTYKQLIVLYLNKGILSHVTTYDVSQFEKI